MYANPSIWRALTSPSSLAIGVLVGFLLVGQISDWKFIPYRASRPKSSVRFGVDLRQVPGHQRTSSVPLRGAARDSLSEIVDRRDAHDTQTSKREID